MNPPPPIPHDWGRATLRPKMIDAAASMALPPWSSTERPIADAMGDSVATMPPAPRAAGRYIEPSLAGAAVAANRKQSAPAVALQRPSLIAPAYGAASRSRSVDRKVLWRAAFGAGMITRSLAA